MRSGKEGFVLKEFLFALVTFFSHFVQGITGFGSTALAIPFAVNLVDSHVAIPVLTLLSLVFSAVLSALDRKHIVWREAFKIVLFLAIGAPFGILFFKYLPREIFKPALAVMMILIALWGLLRLISPRCAAVDLPMWTRLLLLVAGGVAQGAFGSSGPFVIFYAEAALKNKGEFRTTLTAMWAMINTIVLPQYFLAGVDVSAVFRLTAVSLPAIFMGMAAGMAAHRRIDQRRFSLIIYTVLLVAGLFNCF